MTLFHTWLLSLVYFDRISEVVLLVNNDLVIEGIALLGRSRTGHHDESFCAFLSHLRLAVLQTGYLLLGRTGPLLLHLVLLLLGEFNHLVLLLFLFEEINDVAHLRCVH